MEYAQAPHHQLPSRSGTSGPWSCRPSSSSSGPILAGFLALLPGFFTGQLSGEVTPSVVG